MKTIDQINECAYRFIGESEMEYFIRLHENKKKYGLVSQDIAILLNDAYGVCYDESAWRKKFADFNRGRIYEREHGMNAVKTKILAISDLHIPFCLPVSTFSAYANNVDVLVLNGDILDCQSISSFSKQYRVSLVEEMIAARQYIIDLIELIQPKEVKITVGNHEHRLLKYLSNKINEDLLNLMPNSPLDLIVHDGFKNNDRYTRTEIFYKPLRALFDIPILCDDSWYCRVGNVIFAHPKAYSSVMMKTTEKAVTYFTRQSDTRNFTAVVLAHTHKIGFYMSGDIRMYEQGCCCRLDELDYADGKLQSPQQNGYMYICLDNDGNIIEDKTKLITM